MGSWQDPPDSGVPFHPLRAWDGSATHLCLWPPPPWPVGWARLGPHYPTPRILQSLPELSYLLALQRSHAPAAQSAQRWPDPRTDGGEDTPLFPPGLDRPPSHPQPPPASLESGCLSASPLCFPLLGDQLLLQTLLVNPSWHRLPWGPRSREEAGAGLSLTWSTPVEALGKWEEGSRASGCRAPWSSVSTVV